MCTSAVTDFLRAIAAISGPQCTRLPGRQRIISYLAKCGKKVQGSEDPWKSAMRILRLNGDVRTVPSVLTELVKPAGVLIDEYSRIGHEPLKARPARRTARKQAAPNVSPHA